MELKKIKFSHQIFFKWQKTWFAILGVRPIGDHVNGGLELRLKPVVSTLIWGRATRCALLHSHTINSKRSSWNASVIWYDKTKCVCIFTYWFWGNYVLRSATSNFQTLFVFTRSFGRYVDISTGDITHLPSYILAPCATNKYVGPIQLASHILVFD